MKIIALGVVGAALLGSAATAAPLSPSAVSSPELSGIHLVRLVCNEYGRCFRSHGPRYVQRYYGDDGYVVRRSYGSYGGPAYYDRGYGYYGSGPGVGFSFGARGW
ncbi:MULTISPECIES: hypothetical protein [Bradyrhizobium]|uniref:Uncharacterized protein n=1 Tax=Bradyrhizobium elkanii TaxID=29448 RepID=A0A4U6RSL3_BRAEL|nr:MULTISPECIES: hypothetical protein [Bradyrhizobium]MTV19056.1 hypothetical protein [Bradyrhizobium sp. BR2003]TKV77879.1 hypothetical protein FDV58_28855 [Bradyrhizobium elkanii]